MDIPEDSVGRVGARAPYVLGCSHMAAIDIFAKEDDEECEHNDEKDYGEQEGHRPAAEEELVLMWEAVFDGTGWR